MSIDPEPRRASSFYVAAAALELFGSMVQAQAVPDSLKSSLQTFKETRSVCSSSVVDVHARGAYFRKIQSEPSESAVGVTGRPILPQVAVDPKRMMPSRAGDPAWWAGPLDRPSVYLGAAAPGIEVDAGLSWERVVDAQGKLTDAYGFRPFWRVTRGGKSVFGPPPEEAAKPVYQPGQALTMTLTLVADDRLELSISGAGAPSYSTAFAAPGLPLDGAGRPRSFKRVNAIDQYRRDAAGDRHGNEGFDAAPTAASALGGSWASAGVLTDAGYAQPLFGGSCRVVLSPDRASTAPPAVTASSPHKSGGETVDLAPGR